MRQSTSFGIATEQSHTHTQQPDPGKLGLDVTGSCRRAMYVHTYIYIQDIRNIPVINLRLERKTDHTIKLIIIIFIKF